MKIERQMDAAKVDGWELLEAWRLASPAVQQAALDLIHTGHTGPVQPELVVRWPDAARRLGVTTRALRNAVARAGIEPVCLPGRERSIGLAVDDLRALARPGKPPHKRATRGSPAQTREKQ